MVRRSLPLLRCVEDYSAPGVEGLDSSSAATMTLAHAVEARDAVLVEAGALDMLGILQASTLAPALVYIDPPYASHRDYLFTQTHPGSGEAIARVAFSDRWDDGSMDAYVASLSGVLAGIHAALSSEGSLLLHVDPRGAPYLAIVCDRVFGMGERLAAKRAPGFRNELIWSYGLGGSSPRSWPKKHDNILWYTKGSDWYFDPPLTPARSQRMKGMLKKQPDVIEIATINNMAKDRTGYPTQKPLELLSMLVGAHTRPGELVVDLYSGSGTTAVAAFALGRKALASDVAADAIAVARQRLLAQGARVAVFRAALPTGSPDLSALIFEQNGFVKDGCFCADEAGDQRLVRDVYGVEGVVAR